MPVAPIAALLALAGQSVALQVVLIMLATFVLEDAATVLVAMHARWQGAGSGGIAVPVALAALYGGIVLGDLGLFALGRLAARSRWAERLMPRMARLRGRLWLDGRVFRAVFLARFLPGARLPTYTVCGFLGADWKRFALAAILATLVWTSLLFGIALQVGELLMQYLSTWRWAGGIGFAVLVVLLGRTAARLQEARR